MKITGETDPIDSGEKEAQLYDEADQIEKEIKALEHSPVIRAYAVAYEALRVSEEAYKESALRFQDSPKMRDDFAKKFSFLRKMKNSPESGMLIEHYLGLTRRLNAIRAELQLFL